MKILVVGGGSGGHITPAVAVVRKILELRPRAKIEFWTDKKYYKNVVKITTEVGVRWGEESKAGSVKKPYIRVRKVAAGKFHRYAGRKVREYFEDFGNTMREMVIGNMVGFIRFMGGIFQTLIRLLPKSERPDVIFLKGGFVGLPVGLVARLLKIPYIIHESDAVAGLANRILMKKAKVVAMGVPFEMPKYDDKSSQAKEMRRQRVNWEWVGIPVAEEFKKVSKTKQGSLKKACGFEPERPLVIITGGSQGALHINEAVKQILPEMLKFTSVGLVAGRKYYELSVELKKYEDWEKAKLVSNFRLWSFNPVMSELLGAADVVVSRAGATTVAELAALGKAVILIPFEKLPGGHQVKNAERLVKLGAAEALRDDKMVKDPEKLLELVRSLVRSPKRRERLAENLHGLVKPTAAEDLAKIIIEAGKEER